MSYFFELSRRTLDNLFIKESFVTLSIVFESY